MNETLEEISADFEQEISKRKSIEGEELRNMREENKINSILNEEINKSTTASPIPTSNPIITDDLQTEKYSIEEGMFFVIERLKEINFELSESQPDTEKDGNCAIWVLLDQMSYDFKWKSTAKSSNVASMRKQIISSLKQHLMILLLISI